MPWTVKWRDLTGSDEKKERTKATLEHCREPRAMRTFRERGIAGNEEPRVFQTRGNVATARDSSSLRG